MHVVNEELCILIIGCDDLKTVWAVEFDFKVYKGFIFDYNMS